MDQGSLQAGRHKTETANVKCYFLFFFRALEDVDMYWPRRFSFLKVQICRNDFYETRLSE